MSVGPRFRVVGLLTATVFLRSSPLALAQSSLTVQWTEGRLSVVAHDVSLARVLREIAHQTGVEIVGLERIQQSRSIEFADKLLADGLKLLLADIDYVMAVRDPMALATRSPVIRIWLYFGSPPTDVPVQLRDPDVPTLEEPSASFADGTQSEDAVPGWETIDHELTQGAEASESIDQELAQIAEASVSTDQELTQNAEASDADSELQELESSGFFDQANESSVFQATKSENAAVRARALNALNERNSAMSVDAFATAMIDPDPAVSSVASALMADSNAPEVLENLGSVLRHPDPVLRFNALELLARRGDPDSLPHVQQLLNDENETIRMTAQQLVEQLERVNRGR